MATDTVSVRISDMTRQRSFIGQIPRQASWGESLRGILDQLGLNLPANPDAGEDVVWTGRLEREGRHLHASELVGDALHEGDEVTIQRDIQAG
ncbi:MAG: hypothetical protein KA184_04405 [Candidatus Hydrogenedentes bacterium]|nr:hypothetical protein [Candidatus Hydrogenedentota bacterium]